MTQPLDLYPWDIKLVMRVYPQVTTLCSQNGALDEDENPVELDASLLDPLVADFETEVAWERLREERNIRLSETDWMTVSDRTASAEQLAYRQALRDLPANTTDPANPTWPTEPS
jgi:predicted DNA binding CopG/RHH family protein